MSFFEGRSFDCFQPAVADPKSPRVGTLVQDIYLSSHDLQNDPPETSTRPVSIDELAHDLRQPLSAIESLAYYLEMTSTDDHLCKYLEHIRAMVNRANFILDMY
ncbi:MAG TPA: histidine kinase dimerization/phospho-acceptor domain-containing protein [Bryobacteraceae bacterium]|nr:histidine kinase dimerization/phospho-acceptor domain-containing protein [Bryobacteraceae bacterium]